MLNLNPNFSRLVPSPKPPSRASQSRLNLLKNSSNSYKRLKKFLVTENSLTYIHKYPKKTLNSPKPKSSTPTLPILNEKSMVSFLPPINSQEIFHNLNTSYNFTVRPDPNPEKSDSPNLKETLKPLTKPIIYETQNIKRKIFPLFREKIQLKILKNKIKVVNNRISLGKKPIVFTETEKICGWEAESNFPE